MAFQARLVPLRLPVGHLTRRPGAVPAHGHAGSCHLRTRIDGLYSVRGIITTTAGLSTSVGPTEPPLLQHTIPEHFASIVSRYGDRPAVSSRSPTPAFIRHQPNPAQKIPRSQEPGARETSMTYEDLDLVSNSLAHSLRSLGVEKGDRVVVGLGNCPEFAALTYAVFKLGAILVPLNPAFNEKQVKAALRHLEAKILIIGAVTDLAYKPCYGRSNEPLLRAMIPDLDSPSGMANAPDIPTLETVVLVDNSASHPLVVFPSSCRSLTPFSSLLETGALSPNPSSSSCRPVTPSSPLSPAETINIQFTSGTTASPKAAMLSHTNILNNGYLIAKRMGLQPSDLIVCPPPLFHCFGCVLGYMATATTGAGIAFPSPAFDPLATLTMAADHRATGLYGVSTMFVSMLDVLENRRHYQENTTLPSEDKLGMVNQHLLKGIAAGSSIPQSLMNKIYNSLGLRNLVICYGMTETSPVSCMTSPTDPEEKRTGSIGRVMPHTKVKVVSPTDRTKTLFRGHRGELATAGYLVMQGYWGDEERTREDRIPDEQGEVWMYSGDEARMDEDGYVEITGRIKDLIIRGGENIHPLEIENCLFQHPAITEASVVGVPDDKYGESVCAFIIGREGIELKPDEDYGPLPCTTRSDIAQAVEQNRLLTKQEVRAWVQKHLSSHLVPKHIWWTTEFPKTPSGKIQKFMLRELAVRLLAKEKEERDRRGLEQVDDTGV
ncbi:hypothetical protein B0H63DRAFT_483321 [Podospora didyma]|uniref:Uncharacterized protein n=1 Tax=Podospora didyma TaxID=330526 RepID=A0AAE0K9D0_9PEZI|nr:hypothetical protein B0H63DRAFT_483321 [Podospora didyma]